MRLLRAAALLVTAFAVVACRSDAAPSSPDAPASPPVTATSGAEATATETAAAPSATQTPTPAPTATPVVIRQDIRATYLRIPALNIDASVQGSLTVPYSYVPEPGCPPGPEDSETLTVPEQGIATPEEAIEGMENKSWIFGHSRWLGTPGLLFVLQDIGIGDELFIDGIDRQTGETLTGLRYVVDGLYLSDVDSGDRFLTASGPGEMPAELVLILQTSVRERGTGKQWILDRESLLSKAENIVEGDLDDPCKYLLLFVSARRI